MDKLAYDLFIAAPMSALAPDAYADGRQEVLALMRLLSDRHGFGSIYFAGADIGEAKSFTGEGEALKRDLAALRASRFLVLIYPSKIVTSALVEVGYALALDLPCLLLVQDRRDLPYLLNQAERGEAGDMLPTIEIQTSRGPDAMSAAVAAFRDRIPRWERSHGR